MAHSREGSRWSPELCFALFLLSSTSGNLLCLPNRENESGVKAIQMRWLDEPLQVQYALILPGRASMEAKGETEFLLACFDYFAPSRNEHIVRDGNVMFCCNCDNQRLPTQKYSSSHFPGLSQMRELSKSCSSNPSFQLGE